MVRFRLGRDEDSRAPVEGWPPPLECETDKAWDAFDYTWHWFTKVRDFYGKAAAADRAVIFTVDQ